MMAIVKITSKYVQVWVVLIYLGNITLENICGIGLIHAYRGVRTAMKLIECPSFIGIYT